VVSLIVVVYPIIIVSCHHLGSAWWYLSLSYRHSGNPGSSHPSSPIPLSNSHSSFWVVFSRYISFGLEVSKQGGRREGKRQNELWPSSWFIFITHWLGSHFLGTLVTPYPCSHLVLLLLSWVLSLASYSTFPALVDFLPLSAGLAVHCGFSRWWDLALPKSLDPYR